MKKSILTLVLIGATVSVMGQGFINYSTRVVGSVVGRVYGTDPSNVRVSGPTATDTPTGTTVYAVPTIGGSGFSAQLFALSGADQPENALLPVAGTLTSFRTGSSLGGTIFPSPVQLPVAGVPVHGTGTFQLRAWDNAGGTIATWDLATIRGNSDKFNVSNLGDGVLDFPADLTGFRSFNLTIVPEPSTFVLAGMGAAALLIFRRRK